MAVLLSAALLSSNLSWADEALEGIEDPVAATELVTPELQVIDETPAAEEGGATDGAPVEGMGEPSEEASEVETAFPPEEPAEQQTEAAEKTAQDPEAAPDGDAPAVHTLSTDGPEVLSLTDSALIQPMAVGPDGGAAPYVYWDVRDTEGNLVPGATFQFQYRSGNWQTGNNAGAIADCDGTCSSSSSGNVLDRDSDGGEFLLEHRGTNRNAGNRLSYGSNYSVQQVDPPVGYVWVQSNDSRRIGQNSRNDATWNNEGGAQTHNFGTFQVRKLQLQPLCTAGYVYGVSATGQLQQVDQSGTVTSIGTPAGNVDSFNGLGIGSSGGPVFAYQRTNSSRTVTMHSYDTSTGLWVNTGDTFNTSTTANGSFSGSLIAGAINLSNDIYMFGGFQTTVRNSRYTQVFKIWEYDPESASPFTYKGYIETYSGWSNPDSAPSGYVDGSNGDMAFDAAGNLYVVRGVGPSTTVFSVTAANLAAATGGSRITTSGSKSFDTMGRVNGVAFDASGKAYLGSSTEVRSYDMPDWTNGTTVTGTNYSGTDLATCSSPPTIVIEKEVIGGRVNAGDQFKLSLHQGTTLLGEATTTGSETGLQGDRVGPLPTVRNVELNFAEVATGTTNLNNYASAYQCTVTHLNGTVQSLQQVTGTSGSITIPASGEAVRCVFRNSPLIANVSINKQVTDALGHNPQPDAGWRVGAAVAATTGSATQTPSATTQETNSSGAANWSIAFGAFGHRATLTVSEDVTSKPGYEFLSGQCVVTSLSGDVVTTDLTGPEATALSDVKPGDQVDCTYVNKPAPGALAIEKAFNTTVPDGFGEIEFKGDYVCTLDGSTVVAAGMWTRTGSGPSTLTATDGWPPADQIPAGASCAATENQPTGSDGLPNGSYEWDTYSVDDPVTIASGATGTITVTNKAKRVFGIFSVTKVVPEGSVVDDGMQFSGTWSCELGDETVTGNWGPIAGGETWTAGENAGIPLGAECGVTSEVRPDVPVATDPSYSWDGEPDLGEAVASAGIGSEVIPTVTVTNTTKRALGSVTWVKVDEAGNPLSGSEWSLGGPALFNGGNAVDIVDCVGDDATACADSLDKDHRVGYFRVVDLNWGDYTLEETRAPAGYVRGDDREFSIGIGEDLVLDFQLGNIVNEQRGGPVLPLTGGIGRDFFAILGLGVLALGLGAAAAGRMRGRRKEVA